MPTTTARLRGSGSRKNKAQRSRGRSDCTLRKLLRSRDFVQCAGGNQASCGDLRNDKEFGISAFSPTGMVMLRKQNQKNEK
jgi:hypothetical protein